MNSSVPERSRPVVLVADDDAHILELVSFRLERAGYDVVAATDGEEALQRAVELRPDLAVLDVMMPTLSGYEVTQALRQKEATRTASSASSPFRTSSCSSCSDRCSSSRATRSWRRRGWGEMKRRGLGCPANAAARRGV